MNILTFGSAGGAPTKRRNCTSFALKLESYAILLDCGEGTQRQMLVAGFKLSKIKYIFISHLHADHVAGLVPMLATKSMFGIPGDLIIVGPKGLKEYIEFNLSITGSKLNYGYQIIEIEDGNEIQFPEFKFSAYSLNHRIPCFGYRIKFKDKPGNLLKEKMDKFGIKEGPVCGRLQKGEIIELENGNKISLKDVAGQTKIGKTIAYVADTYLCKAIYKIADNADFMLIESTFLKEHTDRAEARFHLTSYMCGNLAARSGVKKLMLYHFSAAYIKMDRFIEEAAEKYSGPIYLANDLEEIEI